jgi:HK97 gp10 family phage protein
MLSAKVIRKKQTDYPKKFREFQRQFLEEAGLFIQGEAVERVPVDGGRLKGSITHEVKDDHVIIGTNVEYAPHVEYGTRPHTINGPVKIKNVGWRYIGTHPGTRAQPFLRPALDENKRRLNKMFRDVFRRVFGGR